MNKRTRNIKKIIASYLGKISICAISKDRENYCSICSYLWFMGIETSNETQKKK
jgi:hypothetical protein